MSLTAKLAEFHLTALAHARKHRQIAAETERDHVATDFPDYERLHRAEVHKNLASAERWERRAAAAKADGTGNLLIFHDADMELHWDEKHQRLMSEAAACYRTVYEGTAADPKTTFASNPNAPRTSHDPAVTGVD